MDFGLMFFSSVDYDQGGGKYALLLDAVRFADEHGFCCVWTPERHFHEFGGLFPNPALTSAALATITDRIELRAGSLISPLHHTVRIAEDWSVVDNLSGGRVAVSFGSGWNVDDFVLFPDRYETRKEVMLEQIELVRALWRGETVRLPNGSGKEIDVAITPKPVQPELPVWITSSGSPETFAAAGRVGAHVLTHLLGQDLPTLGDKVAAYRAARADHGFAPESGRVALMLHTFLGTDVDEVKDKVREPFRDYIRSAIKLELKSARSGGVVSGGRKVSADAMSDAALEDLVDLSFDRYFETSALLGTPTTCSGMVDRLEDLEVDEIACLIDFGVDDKSVLESLDLLYRLSVESAEQVVLR